MSRLARALLIVSLTCAITAACAHGAQIATQKQCTPDEAAHALDEADGLKDWDAVYRSFKTFGHCGNNGPLAEIYDDDVARLLANDWNHFDALIRLIANDKAFERFVLFHISETANYDDLIAAKKNAGSLCPLGQTYLCGRIQASISALVSTSSGTPRERGCKPAQLLANDSAKPPFSLAIVPDVSRSEGESIAMANYKPRDFYVVLTNISQEPQAVWEYWNSWGYQTISFEFTTADGKKGRILKRDEAFTVNFPSTYVVKAGEHQVFLIHLDKGWQAHPALPKADLLPITLRAVYEVFATPEASQYKVWTGRVESHSYNFKLRQ
jgi:hypothetical protein